MTHEEFTVTDDEFPAIGWVFGAAMVGAGSIVGGLLLARAVPSAPWVPVVLFVGVGLLAGARVGWRASRDDLSTAVTVGFGLLAWGLLFPLSFLAGFLVLRSVLLGLLPSLRPGLTPLTLGFALVFHAGVTVVCFAGALAVALAVGGCRDRLHAVAGAE